MMRAKSMYRDLLRWAACFVVGAAFVSAGCSSDSSQKQDPDQSEEIREPGVLEAPADEQSPAPTQTEEPPPADQAPAPNGDPGMADPTTQPNQPNQQAVSEKKLDAFIDTLEDVAALERTYRQRIAQTDKQEEAKQLQQEAQQKVQLTIAQGELPKQEFMSLLQRMQRDVQFRKRVDEKLRTGG